jgi:hypothetical protein
MHHYSIEESKLLSLNSIFRWVNGESRDQTVDALAQLVDSCISQRGLTVEETTKLTKQLIDAATGIKNLSITYKDDSTTCAGLEYIMETINEYVNKNNHLLPDEYRMRELVIEEVTLEEDHDDEEEEDDDNEL